MNIPSCEIVKMGDSKIVVHWGGRSSVIILQRFYKTKEIVNLLLTDGDRIAARNSENYAKNINALFYKKVGITPSNLRKIINAAVRERLIEGKEEIFKRYCFSKNGKVSWEMVRLINERIDVIRQVREDGLNNVEPFAVYLGKSPSELKAVFGKGLWKKLCKNSMTRNKKIAEYLYRYTRVVDIKNTALKMNDIPSTVMTYRGYRDWGFVAWVIKATKGDKSLKSLFSGDSENTRWVFGMYNTYNDTKRMAEMLNAHFSEEWSVEKMLEKHKEYEARILEQRFSKEPFPYVGATKVDNVEHGEYTATLIKSAYDLAKEGRDMHHCVGSYHKHCAKGEYYVYSITKGGEKYSTLAFWYDEKRGFTFNQHYKACNKPVDGDGANELAKILIDKLNKKEEIENNLDKLEEKLLNMWKVFND